MASRVYFNWHGKQAHRQKTGVSLHGHTLHSRESLDFIHKATLKTPWLSGVIRRHQREYKERQGQELDLTRAWWTPPLTARQAWELERSQIEHLGMQPLVSLTDHDTIDGCVQLRLGPDTATAPVSVEWTVPFRQTFFHIGVHNIRFHLAAELMRAMSELTACPDEESIRDLLAYLADDPATLTVLNHPLWDESHAGTEVHRRCALELLERYRGLIHGLELNGLRSWQENRSVVRLAAGFGVPLVSGGDRHGKQANACINLTSARSFAEFAREVRVDRHSEVLFLNSYLEPLWLRVVESIAETLEYNPSHGLGWNCWTDRVFYLCDDGVARSVRELCGSEVPPVVDRLIPVMGILKNRGLKSVMGLARPGARIEGMMTSPRVE